MPRKVIGLDISANRIAYGICDSVRFIGSCVVHRGGRAFAHFLREAMGMIAQSRELATDIFCVEINLHPNVMHKGHVSPKKIRAYMRSRWVEGAVFAHLQVDEPSEIVRKKGGYSSVELGHFIYSMAATWSKDAKVRRRYRMLTLYAAHKLEDLSEDEIDALAIAHDCAVALNLAERGIGL